MPLLLALESHDNYVPLSFKFNPLWLNEEESQAIIEKEWGTYIEGSLAFILESKLRLVKTLVVKVLKHMATIPHFFITKPKVG